MHADHSQRQNDTVLRETGQQEAEGEDVDSNIRSYQLVSRANCIACRGEVSLYSPPVPARRTFLDSGASEHCWVQQSDFVEYIKVKGQGGSSAISGDTGRFEIAGTGTVQFITQVRGVERLVQLQGVKHTPSFGHNLISLTTLDGRGMRGEWGHGIMTVKAPGGEVVMEGYG